MKAQQGRRGARHAAGHGKGGQKAEGRQAQAGRNCKGQSRAQAGIAWLAGMVYGRGPHKIPAPVQNAFNRRHHCLASRACHGRRPPSGRPPSPAFSAVCPFSLRAHSSPLSAVRHTPSGHIVVFPLRCIVINGGGGRGGGGRQCGRWLAAFASSLPFAAFARRGDVRLGWAAEPPLLAGAAAAAISLQLAFELRHASAQGRRPGVVLCQ